MNKIHYLIIILLLPLVLFAQMDRETRAVWVSTNFRLDWPPPTYDAAEQQQALLNILDDIERMNLNTVYFQVRFNSTVLFASNFEPWSFYLTGETGGEPSYDPLKFMIDEAHKRGLELHAWVNTARALGSSEPQILNYDKHIINTIPEWLTKVDPNGKESYWYDPGRPEVRRYLKDVITELAIYYSVDGIQLDFIRYPEGGIDDDFSYSLYGENLSKADWRRENITELVSIIREDLNEINPYIKLGVTPIGIYKNNGSYNGMQGFEDVYQDSYTWLAQNLVDYAAPQVYWNIDDNPRFELVARDWVNNSTGNNIVIGIATYKDDVRPETSRMIDISRNLNASGVAFFRYSNIKNQVFHQFHYKSLPSEMIWKRANTPAEPDNLAAVIIEQESNKILLSWDLPEKYIYTYNIKYVALFSLEDEYDVLDSKNLFKLVPAARSKISFSISRPSKMHYYYAAKSIDVLWNESGDHTNIAEVYIPRLKTISEKLSSKKTPVLVKNDNEGNYILISSVVPEEITISGTGANESAVFVRNNSLQQGINILSLPDDLENIGSILIEYRNTGKKEALQLQ
jgi:uncharacterized lipoprotein YddW (UPF0748 family)